MTPSPQDPAFIVLGLTLAHSWILTECPDTWLQVSLRDTERSSQWRMVHPYATKSGWQSASLRQAQESAHKRFSGKSCLRRVGIKTVSGSFAMLLRLTARSQTHMILLLGITQTEYALLCLLISSKQGLICWVQWCTPLTPAFRRQRQGELWGF